MTHRQLSGLKSMAMFTTFFALFSVAAFSQAQPAARITQAVNDSALFRVPNSTHPLTAGASDIGRVDGNQRMDRMVLVLKPSDAQEAELDRLIDRQHDKESADYKKWITPEQYGKQFGVSESDLNRVKAWLQQEGFRIDTVAHGRQWIEFSGNAAQVEQAFHTEMHHYIVKGEKHVANSRDIALPQALAPVVSGILSLHDFVKKSGSAKSTHVRRDPTTGKLVPDFTLTNSNGTFHALTPGDYKKIYNTEPLLNSGINGQGVSIAIVGRTDIFPSDMHTFRQIFGLPVNDPVIITNGVDPGVNQDFVESSLDLEWSGAVAPGATIKFVTSGRTFTTDGVDLSTSYVIDNAVAPIMSTSYSACEPFLGTAGNAHFRGLYRQAAAEGITAFVSTGDDGSATCDPAGVFAGPAVEGPAISGLASTPYTVSVGGTQFNENGLDGNYWLANNRPDLSSAVGYIPEQVWNESCDPTVDPNQCLGSGLYFMFATGGGPSNCSTSTLSGDSITCISGTPKPSWQAGVGVPDDGVRDVPDLALSAANHDGYLVCDGGFCETTTGPDGQTILTNADVIFGTSASTPAMAGIMALLEQAHGQWQGLANYSLYQLAAMENLGGCNSSKITNPAITSNCVFYDVTSGNNGVPGVPGYKAGKGYDMGTGLGSVNAANLVNAWDSAKKLKSKTALSVGITSVQHGQAVPLQVVVKPVSGTGAPSGIFSLVPDGHPPVYGGTLTHGTFSGNVNDLPGGDYNFKVQYEGDAMFGHSQSGVVGIHVAPEDAVVTVRALCQLFEGGIWIPITQSVTYSQPLALSIDVHGVSQVGFAGGKVEILEDEVSIGEFPLNQNGTALITVTQLPASTGILPGHHQFRAVYEGNSSFKSSGSAGVPVVVDKGLGMFGMYSPVESTTLGTPVLLPIYAGGGLVLPTGTVSLTDNGKALVTLPLTMTGIQGSGFPQAVETLNLPVGAHNLKLSYSGDSNYQSFIRFPPFYTLTVNPATGAAAKVILHQSPAVVTVGQSVNYTIAVRPENPGAIPTGTVNLLMNVGESDSFTLPTFTPVPLVNGNATFTVPWNGRGRYLFVADYSGDAKYSPTQSNVVVTVVEPATPTVTLTATPSGLPPNVQTELTAIIVGAPNNPNLVLPDGVVQFFDSVDGGPELRLGGWRDDIGGTGQFSICVYQVKLSSGTHVIRARYLGNQPGGLNDWGPADSNRVTVVIP
jgi:hypothetical protein